MHSILDVPFLPIQSYVDHIATHQKSSQTVIQSLKKKVDEMQAKEQTNGNQIKEVIDSNLQLKSDLSTAKNRERQLEGEVASLKKKCESLEFQMKERNNLLQNAIPSICDSIQKACQTIQADAHRININFHKEYASTVVNIIGAANYSVQEVQRIHGLICPNVVHSSLFDT